MRIKISDGRLYRILFACMYSMKEGGIYLDTDMFVVKPFDDLLDASMFIGAERDDLISCGIIGAEKGHALIKESIGVLQRTSTNRKIFQACNSKGYHQGF